MLCVEKRKENAYGNEEHMRKDSPGSSRESPGGDREDGEQHTKIYSKSD